MRKIEQAMVKAIKDKKDFFKTNTQVICKDTHITVKLYGHTIAKSSPTGLILTNAGYPTNTTHSRLRALTTLLDTSMTVKGHKGDTLFIMDDKTEYNHIELGDYNLCVLN